MKVVILSDRATSSGRVPLSALIACGGVHHHLVLQKKRAKIALMVETGEAREVHHLCVLVGYGADAVCPWLVMETIHKVGREKLYAFRFAICLIVLNLFLVSKPTKQSLSLWKTTDTLSTTVF